VYVPIHKYVPSFCVSCIGAGTYGGPGVDAHSRCALTWLSQIAAQLLEPWTATTLQETTKNPYNGAL
jgi:hypothetical protein